MKPNVFLESKKKKLLISSFHFEILGGEVGLLDDSTAVSITCKAIPRRQETRRISNTFKLHCMSTYIFFSIEICFTFSPEGSCIG